MQLPELSKLLNYKNAHVLARYRKDFPENRLTAEEALTDLLKYFWLSQKHKQDCHNNPHDESLKFTCSMHYEMKEMDDMWHTFLLFTKDYQDFCQIYFGEYLHHVPETNNKLPELQRFEMDFRGYLSYIYDHLGEETVKRWFTSLLD